MVKTLGFVWTGMELAVLEISWSQQWGSGAYKNYGRYLDAHVDESGKIQIKWPSLNAKDEKGVAFNSLAFALPQAIFYILVKQGCHNIIIDTAVSYKGEDADYLKCVNPEQFDVYVFKLRITEETAKARSKVRDGAQIPYYLSQIGGWDLVIDTDDMTVEEVGQTILDHIENNEPRAINEEPLRKYYNPTLLLIG